MRCPNCQDEIPGRARTCPCGWEKAPRRLLSANERDSRDGWSVCGWERARRCQMIAVIFSPSRATRGYCRYHYRCLMHPEWSDDEAMFVDWWESQEKFYGRPPYSSARSAVWRQLQGLGQEPDLLPFAHGQMPAWADTWPPPGKPNPAPITVSP